MTAGGTRSGTRLDLDLMVIGAAKSATSSLTALLHTAPGVTGNPSDAEIGYFLHDDQYARGPAPALAKYFATPPGSGETRVGKSAGLMYSEAALHRLHDDSPDVRAVAVLRNPVSRAYSGYLWAVRSGFETDDFDAAIARERAGRDLDLPRPWLRRYLDNGEYARHLDVARGIFGDALVVLTMEDFTADPTGTVNTLLAPYGRVLTPDDTRSTRTNTAAGIRSARLARVMRSPRLRAPLRRLLPPQAQAAVSRRARKLNEREVEVAPMTPATRAVLAEHFAPWNRRLEEQLGRDLGWS